MTSCKLKIKVNQGYCESSESFFRSVFDFTDFVDQMCFRGRIHLEADWRGRLNRNDERGGGKAEAEVEEEKRE